MHLRPEFRRNSSIMAHLAYPTLFRGGIVKKKQSHSERERVPQYFFSLLNIKLINFCIRYHRIFNIFDRSSEKIPNNLSVAKFWALEHRARPKIYYNRYPVSRDQSK